jgi:methionyl-tRNA formyltransferase
MIPKQDIIFCIAGKNKVASESLAFLLESNLVGSQNICVLPVSKGEDLAFMQSLKGLAHKMGIRVIDDCEELYGIHNLVFMSLEYDKLINTDRFVSHELFNVHFSLLPAYKGQYTSAWPILNGEEVTGVTLHKIDNGIDTGEIIDQIQFSIDLEDTCRDLYIKYNTHGVEIFKRNLCSLLERTYKATPQTFYKSSYYSRSSIDFKNFKIDLHKTALEVHNQIRAYIFAEYQLPMVHDRYVIKSEILDALSKGKPGTIIMEDKETFIISTIDYKVKLYKKVER